MALSASTPQHLHKIGLLGEIQNDKGMILLYLKFLHWLLDKYAYSRLHVIINSPVNVYIYDFNSQILYFCVFKFNSACLLKKCVFYFLKSNVGDFISKNGNIDKTKTK